MGVRTRFISGHFEIKTSEDKKTKIHYLGSAEVKGNLKEPLYLKIKAESIDRYGKSTITGILEGRKLSLEKKYDERENVIHIEAIRGAYNNDCSIFMGEYHGEGVEGGDIRMVMANESPSSFLEEIVDAGMKVAEQRRSHRV